MRKLLGIVRNACFSLSTITASWISNLATVHSAFCLHYPQCGPARWQRAPEPMFSALRAVGSLVHLASISEGAVSFRSCTTPTKIFSVLGAISGTSIAKCERYQKNIATRSGQQGFIANSRRKAPCRPYRSYQEYCAQSQCIACTAKQNPQSLSDAAFPLSRRRNSSRPLNLCSARRPSFSFAQPQPSPAPLVRVLC